MAVRTIFILNTTAVTPNWWGNTQLDGSAPTANNSIYGWTPSTTNAATTPYFRGRLGASSPNVTSQAASYNASTTGPTPGTGSASTQAGDSFIAGPFNSTFDATPWTFNWNLRASSAGCVGHVNMQVWKSANANGSSPTLLLANTAGATVSLSSSGDVNSSISWSPGVLTLTNEYLFFQVEWQETTTGTAGANVLFRVGTALISTPDVPGAPQARVLVLA